MGSSLDGMDGHDTDATRVGSKRPAASGSIRSRVLEHGATSSIVATLAPGGDQAWRLSGDRGQQHAAAPGPLRRRAKRREPDHRAPTGSMTWGRRGVLTIE